MLRPYRGLSPRVHPSAFIDDSAQVIGDVEIGEDSSVWMCAVIRGDVHSIRIGRRTNVQDGTVVHAMTGTHPTAIGDNVTIGHGAIIHGCTIDHLCANHGDPRLPDDIPRRPESEDRGEEREQQQLGWKAPL